MENSKINIKVKNSQKYQINLSKVCFLCNGQELWMLVFYFWLFYYIQMNLIKQIDRIKIINLAIGIAGIYITFIVGGVLHEQILKKQYHDRFSGEEDYFVYAGGLITVQKFIIFLFGLIYNAILLPKQSIKPLPAKNSLMCAGTIFLSSLTNNYAILFVSFPIVIMFKSCNILSVILIAVMCSRVRDSSLKLGKKKMFVAISVTLGIIIFKVFDPVQKIGDQKKVQILGLCILFISLLADGFLPDFQAQIKQKYKPQPTVMMVEINKWCFIVSLTYTVISGQSMAFLQFAWRHPLFVVHLLSMNSFSFIGHIFIYKMIKDFKQHIVPFVITTRKIITVGISMVYFGHTSSFMQICGILLVFVSTLYQFVSQMVKQRPTSSQINQQQIVSVQIFVSSFQKNGSSLKQNISERECQGQIDKN